MASKKNQKSSVSRSESANEVNPDAEFSVTRNGKALLVCIGIKETLVRSKSGKTYLIASTHGIQPTGLKINNREVMIGLNAFISAKAANDPANP